MPIKFDAREDTRLTELVRQGFTYAACAVMLAGEGFPPRTRNSVVGRGMRLGLRGGASARPPGRPASKPDTPKPARQARAFNPSFSRQPLSKRVASVGAKAETVVRQRAKEVALVRDLRLAAPVPATAVAFLAVREGQCRFPLWGDRERPAVDHLFVCGAPTIPGSSYCTACRARTTAFTPRLTPRNARPFGGEHRAPEPADATPDLVDEFEGAA